MLHNNNNKLISVFINFFGSLTNATLPESKEFIDQLIKATEGKDAAGVKQAIATLFQDENNKRFAIPEESMWFLYQMASTTEPHVHVKIVGNPQPYDEEGEKIQFYMLLLLGYSLDDFIAKYPDRFSDNEAQVKNAMLAKVSIDSERRAQLNLTDMTEAEWHANLIVSNHEVAMIHHAKLTPVANIVVDHRSLAGNALARAANQMAFTTHYHHEPGQCNWNLVYKAHRDAATATDVTPTEAINYPGIKLRNDFQPVQGEFGNARIQAMRIFTLLQQELNNDPNKKIALLYAANDQQARQLHSFNDLIDNNENIPDINGSGQAKLFGELIKLINHNNLQHRIHIAPVATSLRGGNNPKDNIIPKPLMGRDLYGIQQHLEAGFTVYGLARVRPDGQVEASIGGGNSAWWVNDKMADFDGKTQNEYFQEQLREMAARQDKLHNVQPAHQQDNAASKLLDSKIKELHQYGLELKNQGYSSDKYKPVLKLAYDINDIVYNARIGKLEHEKALDLLEATIKKGKEDMGGNRRVMDILAHIGICLTGVGLFAVIGNYLYTGSVFFNATKRQSLLEDVKNSVNNNSLQK